MTFELLFTKQADEDLKRLEVNKGLLKVVRKTLGYLETNPKHPSLKTHEYTSLSKQYKIKIFEAYVQNNTPVAYRIFWYYGPNKCNITIIAITAHP